MDYIDCHLFFQFPVLTGKTRENERERKKQNKSPGFIPIHSLS